MVSFWYSIKMVGSDQFTRSVPPLISHSPPAEEMAMSTRVEAEGLMAR